MDRVLACGEIACERFVIEPGKPYRSRFRFVVHDGEFDRAQIDRLWNDYAHPPIVERLEGH